MIVDKIPAYEKVWVIADDFGYRSYEEHYKKQRKQAYLKDHFDITAVVNGKFTSTNPSTIGRLSNALVSMINKQELLPKYVIIVPDDDIIKSLKHRNYGISSTLGHLVDTVMTNFDKAVEIYKDYLED